MGKPKKDPKLSAALVGASAGRSNFKIVVSRAAHPKAATTVKAINATLGSIKHAGTWVSRFHRAHVMIPRKPRHPVSSPISKVNDPPLPLRSNAVLFETVRAEHKTKHNGKPTKGPQLSAASVGASAGGSGFKLVFPRVAHPNAATAVKIVDTTLGSIKHGKHVGKWVARFDRAHVQIPGKPPHPGAFGPHININSAISKVKDPHLPLGSNAALAVTEGAAKTIQVVNKVLLPVAVAIDTVRLGFAIAGDIESGNPVPKRTIKTGASVAGGWTGGYGGAVTGAAIGSMIFPGLGTLFGGIIGGVCGGIGGSVAAESIAEAIVGEDDEVADKSESEENDEKARSKL